MAPPRPADRGPVRAGFRGAFRFRPLERVEPVQEITTRRPDDYPDCLSSWDTGPWVRFCDLASGGFVAVELRHTYKKGWKVVHVGTENGGESPFVAWSLQEFLERALNSEGRLDAIQQGP